MFITLGLLFSVWSTKYNIGSAGNMGPGYFPLLLGSLLSVVGIINVIRSQISTEKIKHKTFYTRPLIFVLLSSVVFGVLLNGLPGLGIPSFGIIVAVFALTFIARLSISPIRLLETGLLAVFLSMFTVVVFVVILEMPLQVLPRIL